MGRPWPGEFQIDDFRFRNWGRLRAGRVINAKSQIPNPKFASSEACGLYRERGHEQKEEPECEQNDADGQKERFFGRRMSSQGDRRLLGLDRTASLGTG